MISKAFSLRNYIMKQLMKTDKSGIMKLPNKGKVDFGEMIIRENLFKKGIDPKTITSERQLDNILNTPHAPTKPKKPGEVIEVDFGNWPEKKAGGGRTGTGLNYLLGEDDQNMRVPYGEGSSWEQFQKEKLIQKWQEYQQYLKNKEKEERQKPYIEERLGTGPGPVLEAADGGRIGLKKGHSPGRRKFLKVAAGLAALPIVGKYFKWAKPAAKIADLTSVPIGNAPGMPLWFKPLVNKVIREGEDMTKQFATKDREIVHATKISDDDYVRVVQDLDSGNVRVEYHGSTNMGEAPIQLDYKAAEEIEPMLARHMDPKNPKGEWLPNKAQKTQSEFSAVESEPEIVNWDGDIEWTGENVVNKVDDLLTDTTKLETYATGKNPNIKKLLKSEQKQKKVQNLMEDQGNQIDYIETKYGPGPDPSDLIDDVDNIKRASGGRVPLGIGGLLGKFSKSEVLIKMMENTIKVSKDSYVKKNFPNFIKELKANPELANDPQVWNFFTKGLPKNQRLVVHSDDTVDFWTQSDFGPHNIETTNKFMKKHPYFTREQAIKIQNMEPEDQILEMKRLETIRNRTKQATGGLAGMLGE